MIHFLSPLPEPHTGYILASWTAEDGAAHFAHFVRGIQRGQPIVLKTPPGRYMLVQADAVAEALGERQQIVEEQLAQVITDSLFHKLVANATPLAPLRATYRVADVKIYFFDGTEIQVYVEMARLARGQQITLQYRPNGLGSAVFLEGVTPVLLKDGMVRVAVGARMTDIPYDSLVEIYRGFVPLSL